MAAEKEKEREEISLHVLEDSLKNLADVLQPSHSTEHPKSLDPLFSSCAAIGDALAIVFKPVENKNGSTYFEQLREICRISNIRFRKVKLVNNFWKNNSGPLLAFYEEKPIALIPNRSNKYEAIDPLTREAKMVNAEIAAKLSRTAVAFYPPFPEGELTGLSIARFCLKKRLPDILKVTLIGAASAFISLLAPFLIRFLFDQVIGDNKTILLWQIIIGLVVIGASSALFLLARSYGVLKILQNIDLKLESALWDRILNLPAHFFRQFTVGNLVQRIYSVTSIRAMVGQNSVKVLISSLFSFFYFLAMIYYSRSLALIGLAVILFSTVISAICIGLKMGLERKILAINGDIGGTLVQMITGIGKLRICAAENRAFAHWAKSFSESKFLQIKAQKYQNVVATLTNILPILSNALLFTAVLFIIAKSMKGGLPAPLSIGTVIAFLAAYVPFSLAIFDATNTAINMVSSIPLWERSQLILKAQPENSFSKIQPGKLNGHCKIENVFFRYEKDAPLILNDIHLEAKSGQMVGIVGHTGCGKSTLVRLLLGFEQPETGSIYYDEKDLSELDIREVRRQIGTVLQNSSLLSGNLYENIVCGGSYTKSEMDEAIHLSGFDRDLAELPMGLQTIVQSGGGTFSVGQAQRLLICRALISKPSLLLFDEATSALDNQTQDLVAENIATLKVTRLIIAHRLSTVKTADLIYVMDKGKIAQSGTFNQLREQEGIFRDMLNLQSL